MKQAGAASSFAEFRPPCSKCIASYGDHQASEHRADQVRYRAMWRGL